MDNTEKARRMIDAFNKVADEFTAEGKPELAKQTLSAIEGCPVASMAKLWDILNRPPRPVHPTENIGSLTTDEDTDGTAINPALAPNDCPGHVASDDDPKVCRRCGTHVDEYRD